MIEKLKNIFRLKHTTDVEQSAEEKLDELFSSLNSDIITLLVGNDFVEYGDSILDYVNEVREEIKNKTGFIYPLVHILSSETLQENELVFKVREKQVFQKFIIHTFYSLY